MQEVYMPKLGDTVEEATIEVWRKKEGEQVSKGEILLEVTTDKATLEVESLATGMLRKILVAAGETVPVGKVIAYVGEKDEPLPEAVRGAPQIEPATAQQAVVEATTGAEQAAAAPVTVQAPPSGRIFASPRARNRAKAERIPLQLIRGTGPGGRIVEADVEAYAQKLAQLPVTSTAREVAFQKGVDLTRVHGTGEGGRITKEDVLAALSAAPVAAAGAAPGATTGAARFAAAPTLAGAPTPMPPGARREPLTAMRRVVAERMTLSKTTIPHYYITIEVDMSNAVAFRTMVAETVGVKFSYNDLLAKCCAIAMQQVPQVNSYFDRDAIVHRAEVNIGYAVALEAGLIVPVVRNVEKKTLAEIARESAELIEKARNKRLTPDEYGNGSLTLSNLGMMGVDTFIPVINPGESAILGIGRIADKVVAVSGGIHIRKMMSITFSGDHRVVDGAVGAKFVSIVKALLEDPQQIK